jgi:Flp pilus assembly protein CpaB
VRRGEPLTDVRLLGAGLLVEATPGLVATPVRLADPAGAALLSPGDRVDVLAAPADGAAPAAPTVAADVTVLAVPTEVEPADGALVVLATTPATAARLAAAAVASRLSVTVRPR